MLYRRAGSTHFWVRFRLRGREVRRSTRTSDRAQAERLEKKLRENAWAQTELNETFHTWDEATARWLTERAAKRSLDRDKEAFGIVAEFFTGLPLKEITAPRVAKLRQVLTVGRKPATVVRLLASIRAVLRASAAWGWLADAPRVLMPKIERGEPRFLTREEFERLHKELPEHLRQMARFSVETGQRYGSVARLQWSAVDLKRKHAYITSGTSKSKKAIALPLNTTALAVLRAQLGKHAVYVFADHKNRAPIGSVKTAWLKAVKRAGLEGFRWHDLRHTWASWHTANGTPPVVLKELGGWASLAMVERYSHLSPGHLAQWVESGTKTGTASRRKRRKRLVYKARRA
jgi:integrase